MKGKWANIVSKWHYDGLYSFYDIAADEDDLRMFPDTENWPNIIRAVLNEDDELVGGHSSILKPMNCGYHGV